MLVADDCAPAAPAERARLLRDAGVRVAGLDTQNATEVPKAAQRYRLLDTGAAPVQALIRKSPDLLAAWAAAKEADAVAPVSLR